MSHDGPSLAAESSRGSRHVLLIVVPLSPNTSAARLLTSDALTWALSAVDLLRGRCGPESPWSTIGVAGLARSADSATSRSAHWSRRGSQATRAGAWAQAATKPQSTIDDQNLLHESSSTRTSTAIRNELRNENAAPHCFGRPTTPHCSRH